MTAGLQVTQGNRNPSLQYDMVVIWRNPYTQTAVSHTLGRAASSWSAEALEEIESSSKASMFLQRGQDVLQGGEQRP